jgi:hypothetical protein
MARNGTVTAPAEAMLEAELALATARREATNEAIEKLLAVSDFAVDANFQIANGLKRLEALRTEQERVMAHVLQKLERDVPADLLPGGGPGEAVPAAEVTPAGEEAAA